MSPSNIPQGIYEARVVRDWSQLAQSGLAFQPSGLVGPSADRAEREEIVVLAISPAEARVVLREGSSGPRLKNTGDELLGGRYVIRQLRTEYVVLEERAGDGRPALEVWVYKAGPDGKSRIRRLETSPGEIPSFQVPVVQPLEPEG